MKYSRIAAAAGLLLGLMGVAQAQPIKDIVLENYVGATGITCASPHFNHGKCSWRHRNGV